MRTEPVLRPALPSEADDITALTLRSKAYWGYDREVLERMRPMLTMNPDQIRVGGVLVAEQDGMLLGYYQLRGEPPDGELVDLFIDPRLIGTGLVVIARTLSGERHVLVRTGTNRQAVRARERFQRELDVSGESEFRRRYGLPEVPSTGVQ